MRKRKILTKLFEEAIRFGIEVEADYWGGGEDKECYIRTPARRFAERAITLGFVLVQPKPGSSLTMAIESSELTKTADLSVEPAQGD